MCDEFNVGVTDANLDTAEGWIPTGYDLLGMVNHLKSVGAYSDGYIAGYLSVIYNPTVCMGIA